MSNPAPRRSAAPLVATWLGAAVGIGLLLALARASQGPLDDPDQAWQRPGFLDAGDLPAPAPTVAPGVPLPGRPTVVFFVGAGNDLAELCEALAESPLPERAATAVVVAGSPPGRCDGAGAVVGDRDGEVAELYGLRRPRGGPPVGYAVVDAAGAIRYRTLDPEVADHVRGGHHGRGAAMTTPVAAAERTTTLRVCLWCVTAVLAEVGLYASYRGHDARFHWFTHFFVGASAALVVMAVVAVPVVSCRRPWCGPFSPTSWPCSPTSSSPPALPTSAGWTCSSAT